LWLVLWAAGCATDLQVDPQGFRCDPGDSCPTGFACEQGVCSRLAADPCVGVVCVAPASECNVAAVRSFVSQCVSGACVLTASQTPCPTTCTAGVCDDPCAKVACTTPPVALCTDPGTLRTFAATGTCQASTGSCAYAPTDVPCAHGCEAGRCREAQRCAQVTCTTPPPSTCVGQSVRSFAAQGTCEPATGVCNYPSTDTPCSAGCMGGQCLVRPLTFTQVGPRVRFAVNAVDVSPQGGAALVVGAQGRVARWNGTDWVELLAPSTANDLNRVQFASEQLAYIAGRGRTLWQLRDAAFTPVVLSGGATANLVGLSARGESSVLVADSVGNVWRYAGNSWTASALPSLDGPFSMKAAHLDETSRERVVGLCGPLGSRVSCVAYRNGSTWFVNLGSGSLGFDAVGGSFVAPTVTVSEALVGQADGALRAHAQSGLVSTVSLPSTSDGLGVVGLTVDGTGASATRGVYLLTSSADSETGHLYQLDKVSGAVTMRPLLDTYFGVESLSPTVASGVSGGVFVAEANQVASANNIFRHGAQGDEALDLGEDFVGASVDPAGTLVVADQYADLGLRRPGAASWAFYRASSVLVQAFEARHGASVLLAGKSDMSSDGVLLRWTPTAGFVRLATKPNTTFTSVCRVSDTEGWAVGTGGALYAVTASGAVSVVSPTTKDLRSVDCVAGAAVACGAEGTVLRAVGGVWAVAQPAFPVATGTLTHCRLAGSVLLVAGNGLFQRLEGATWTALPAPGDVTGLVVRSPTEVYAAVATARATSTNPGASAVVRFDGTQWTQVLAVRGVLGEGVEAGSRLVFGGAGGLLVEGR
jgi:hypothetical protein